MFANWSLECQISIKNVLRFLLLDGTRQTVLHFFLEMWRFKLQFANITKTLFYLCMCSGSEVTKSATMSQSCYFLIISLELLWRNFCSLLWNDCSDLLSPFVCGNGITESIEIFSTGFTFLVFGICIEAHNSYE